MRVKSSPIRLFTPSPIHPFIHLWRAYFMFQKFNNALSWLRSPYALLEAHLQRGELSFMLDLPVLGKSLITGDPAHIAQIVRDKNLIGGRGTQALRPVVGEQSLIVLEGAAHEAQRSALLPHFFTGDMAAHDAILHKWVRHRLAQLRRGQVFSGMKLVADITLNSIIEILFGALSPERQAQAVALTLAWIHSFSHPAILFLKPLQINWGRHSAWGRFLRNRQGLHQFIQELIDAGGKDASQGGVLGQILAQRQQARQTGQAVASDAELISQMVTFLLFGHDTSAAQMGWFFYHLWRDPEALQQVQAEVLTTSNQPDPEQLPLLRSAIQESMRITPVVVHLTRHALAPTQIGHFAIAQGQKVLPCMYLAQRNPAQFEHPGRFMAARFLQTRPEWRYAYFPFGLGQRLCVGMPFALRQMVLIAAQLLLHTQLELVEPERVRPVRAMVLIVPSGGPLLRSI